MTYYFTSSYVLNLFHLFIRFIKRWSTIKKDIILLPFQEIFLPYAILLLPYAKIIQKKQFFSVKKRVFLLWKNPFLKLFCDKAAAKPDKAKIKHNKFVCIKNIVFFEYFYKKKKKNIWLSAILKWQEFRNYWERN